MRKGYVYVLISVLVLLSFGAVAGEAESDGAEARSLEQKKDRAYELRDTTRSDERHELFRLIGEIGPEAFFERFADNEEEVIQVVKKLMVGYSTTEESMVRADVAAYLLKDKRSAVRSEALTQITRLYLYADKLFVADTLYDMYKAAADDDALRARVAKALVLVGSNDMEGKAPRKLDPDEYEENLTRFREMLGDKSPGVRRAVVENLLPSLGTMTKVEIGKIETDPDAEVRAAVIDYYRRAKVKTPHVCDIAIKALASDDPAELDAAIAYTEAMRLSEAREPMLAALKRRADSEGKQALKLRIIDLTKELEWKEAIPDLVWVYKNDPDPVVQTRAAYVILSLWGTPNVLLGTIEEPFPAKMVEPERKALMLAFQAWLICEFEKQGETAEVKHLREVAQFEFSDAVYKITKARIYDTDFANKRRGLNLVMDIGPEEFAKEVNAQEFARLMQSVQEFWQHYARRETEANRQIARMVLAFTADKNKDVQSSAISLLMTLAPFCDRDVFIPFLTPLTQDVSIQSAVTQLINAISQAGYSGKEERERQQRREERDKARSGQQ